MLHKCIGIEANGIKMFGIVKVNFSVIKMIKGKWVALKVSNY